jgi:hypothetical protein
LTAASPPATIGGETGSNAASLLTGDGLDQSLLTVKVTGRWWPVSFVKSELVTPVTSRSLAKTVPGAGLAYFMHISILSPLYCKHYANGPAGTDLASVFFRITVTGITACPIDRLPECAMVGDHVRGITVRWIAPIPVDRHGRICYARGFCPVLAVPL